MRNIKVRDALEQPPVSIVQPDALIGRVVQIALGGSDKRGSPGLVPPLKVIYWSYEKHHYATIASTVSEVCFLGTPLEGFENPVKLDTRLLRATGIRFKSRMPMFQPHFLMDQEFLDYFMRSEEDVVPVEVFVTDSVERMDSNYTADEYNFVFVGEGVLQLFVPGKGFQKRWPKRFPWQSELEAIEKWLLSNDAERAQIGR